MSGKRTAKGAAAVEAQEWAEAARDSTAQEMREGATASLDEMGAFARERPRSTAPGFKTPRSANRLSASDGLRSVSQYLRSHRTLQPNRIAAERRQIAFSP